MIKGIIPRPIKKDLKKHLKLVVLPKKGRLNQQGKEHQYSKEFQIERRKHSAAESAINALQVHGLKGCPDHGIDGFKRYVSLAIVARNIQKLGAELLKLENPVEQLKRSA